MKKQNYSLQLGWRAAKFNNLSDALKLLNIIQEYNYTTNYIKRETNEEQF